MSRNSITPSRAFLHHRRLGVDDRRLAVRAGPAVAHAPGAGRDRLRRALQLDQAHAAIAGDRQPLVEAEARNLRARRLARLQQRELRRDVDLAAVDDDLGHRHYSAATSTDRACRFGVARCIRRCAARSPAGNAGCRPCTGQAAPSPKRADRVALDLLGHVEQHVDLALLRAAVGHARRARATSSPCPRGTACTGRSSRACRNRRCARWRGRCRSTCPSRSRRRCRGRTSARAAVEIHRSASSHLMRRNERHRRAAGDDRQQIVPAAAHAAAMRLDQLAEAECPSPLRRCRAARRGRRCRTAWCRCCSAGRCRRTRRAPRRRMSGTTAMISTLFTVVGQP